MKGLITKFPKKNRLYSQLNIWQRSYILKAKFPESYLKESHQVFKKNFLPKYQILDSNPSIEDSNVMAIYNKKFYNENKNQQQVMDFKNSLKKFFSDKECVAIEIENLRQPADQILKQDIAYKVLVSSSIFENYGVDRMVDDQKKPILQENVSGNYIDFHCDSLNLNVFPFYTAIVCVKSNSKAITSIIEANDICKTLQKNYPQSFAILNEVEFIVQKITPPSFIEYSKPLKIIEKKDNQVFFNYSLLNGSDITSSYLPLLNKDSRFNRLQINQALSDFKTCMRTSLKHHDFALDDRNQVLLIKNRQCVHNREQVNPTETREVVYFVCDIANFIKSENKQTQPFLLFPSGEILNKIKDKKIIRD